MKQNGFTAVIKKTKIVKVNKRSYELPPDNGNFTEYRVSDYFCPHEWSNDGIFIPVKEGDPMWFDLRDNDECAVMVSVQRLNPVTGKPANLEDGLVKDGEQNYLSMPRQRWLDGYINDGKVYQFVVTKKGIGLAVNEFVLPKHMQNSHALGFAFFAPKNPKPKITHEWHNVPGGFVQHNPNYVMKTCSGTTNSYYSMGNQVMGSSVNNNPSLAKSAILISRSLAHDSNCSTVQDFSEETADIQEESVETVNILEQNKNLDELEKASMGMGGRISQTIVSDENTVDYYQEKRSALLTVYLALPEMFDAIMDKGKRKSKTTKDKYVHSGKIGSIQVPLISQE